MRETQREEGEWGEKKKKNGLCTRVRHLHTLDIRIRDKRWKRVLKVKKKKMTTLYGSNLV